MCAFRVDTTQMTSAVGNIQAGADRFGDAKEMLSGIYGRIQSATADAGDAHDKVEGFRDRWNDEFGILSDMLSKFKDTLVNAADVYDTADQEIAAASGPQAGSAPTEV